MEVITSHINADFDTFASMVAAKKLYPKARLVWSGSLERSLKAALAHLTLPYVFERISDIELNDVERLILVDVRHASRIGAFAGIVTRPGLDIHIYDHHPDTTDSIKGSLEMIEPYGSTTTLMALLLKERDIGFSTLEATLLMAGIYEDTANLTYRSTTVADYEAASFLLSAGADLLAVSDMLKHELSPGEVSLLNSLLLSRAIYTVGDVDVTVVEGTLDEYRGEISALAEKIVEMGGVRNLFMLVDSGDRVHVVARSSEARVDVGAVLRALGGGGHRGAASVTLKSITVIQARERVLAELKAQLVPVKLAQEIMSYPPITVTAQSSISSVMVTMRRYNVNAMPVVEGGSVSGVITRQVVDKALHHGLGEATVSEYMMTECAVVEASTTVDEIREKVATHDTRLLPVLRSGVLIGVITRTDLLKLLQQELSKRSNNADPARIRNITGIMGQLPEWLLEVLKEAGMVAERMGLKLFLVGGVVRDLLLRRENLDIDVVVEGGSGIDFAKELAREKGLHMRSHERFKTAVLVFPDGFKIDVATARLEFYDKPGALPTIEQSSLKLDLYRRDFIINTLAVVLNTALFGNLIDFFGAQRDLKEQRIRVLHNLSFVEDPTRVLRAVRFSEKFGFKIDKHTTNLIKNAVKSGLMANASSARLFNELKHIFAEDAPARAVGRLHDLGVLKFIHPSILWNSSTERLFDRARDSLIWYRLLYREEEVEEWLVLLLVITGALKEAELVEAAKVLNISGRRRLQVLGSRGAALRALGIIESGSVGTGSGLYNLCRVFSIESIVYMMARAEKEQSREALSIFVTRLSGQRVFLTGTELIEMGVPEGPGVGRMLKDILTLRLDGSIKTIEHEQRFVLDRVASK